MALHAHDGWYDDDPGPIPPDLDAPEGAPDPLAMIEEAFGFADRTAVPVVEAVEMLADAEPQPERWRIRDDDDAEWAMRHVADAEATLEALALRAKRWQEKIERWFQQAATEPARRSEFFGAHLEWYARTERRDHERLSFSLPSGKVSTRLVGAAAEIADEDALVEWARGHAPDLIRVREDVQVPTLRAATEIREVIDAARIVLASGEVVPWVCEKFLHPGEQVPLDWTQPPPPGVGDGWPTPEEATDLVAQVEVLSSHQEVRSPAGEPIPGTIVRPSRVSVTVKAATT